MSHPISLNFFGESHRCTKEYYLHTLVLPTLLRHADAKLSANGQDLGGEVQIGRWHSRAMVKLGGNKRWLEMELYFQIPRQHMNPSFEDVYIYIPWKSKLFNKAIATPILDD